MNVIADEERQKSTIHTNPSHDSPFTVDDTTRETHPSSIILSAHRVDAGEFILATNINSNSYTPQQIPPTTNFSPHDKFVGDSFLDSTVSAETKRSKPERKRKVTQQKA